MINFKPIDINNKSAYQAYLLDGKERGCEYSFANLFLWGRQKASILHDHLVLFSQYNRRSVYPYPVGHGNKQLVLDAIITDAHERGIPCRITGLDTNAIETLQTLYPAMFRFHCDLDAFDYVYDINDLADLKGRKYQAKRNHLNRFRDTYPDYSVEPLNDTNLPKALEMIEKWYESKALENPSNDFHTEKVALAKAFHYYQELDMEGLVLLGNDKVLAITFGSLLSPDTFDIHFEKAHSDVQGAYAAINYEFARYIREKHPAVRFLNREEDMGIEGLRKAKQRYYPHHMLEKTWACLLEDCYEY